MQKFRPCSHKDSSKSMSLPAGALSISPIRTPSVPYFSINSMGSGLFPKDLDNDLHTIRKKVEPLVNDSEEILGEAACNFIDTEYAWYQRYFGYIL